MCETYIFNSDNRIKLSGNHTIFNKSSGEVYEQPHDSIAFYTVETRDRVYTNEVWCNNCGAKLGDSFMLSENAERRNYRIPNWKLVFVPKYPKNELTTN